jgi:hypothetical protein
MQHFHLRGLEPPSGDSKDVELEPVHILQVGMQIVAAKDRALADEGAAHVRAQPVGIFQQ